MKKSGSYIILWEDRGRVRLDQPTQLWKEKCSSFNTMNCINNDFMKVNAHLNLSPASRHFNIEFTGLSDER